MSAAVASDKLLTEARFLELLDGVLELFDGTLEKRLDPIKRDIAVLKEDVSILKQDVSILKQDVSILKQDVTILKADMKTVKADIVQLKGFQTHEAQAIEDDFNRLLKKHLQREYPTMIVSDLGIKRMNNPFIIDRSQNLTDFDSGYLLRPYKHYSDTSRLPSHIPIPTRETWLDMSYICVVAEAKHYLSRDKIQTKLYQFDLFYKACLLAKEIAAAPEELQTSEHFKVNPAFIKTVQVEQYISNITNFILFFGAAYWQKGVLEKLTADIAKYKEYIIAFTAPKASGPSKIQIYNEICALEQYWYGKYETPNKPLSDEEIMALTEINGAMKYVDFIVQSGERFTVVHTRRETSPN